MTPADIQTAAEMHASIEVFREIEEMVHAISPDRYRRPQHPRARCMVPLGAATERMKQLYTLNEELVHEVVRLHRVLQKHGIEGREEEHIRLNQLNLRQRIVSLVLGLEVGKAFGYGIAFNFDEDWIVFTHRDE